MRTTKTVLLIIFIHVMLNAEAQKSILFRTILKNIDDTAIEAKITVQLKIKKFGTVTFENYGGESNVTNGSEEGEEYHTDDDGSIFFTLSTNDVPKIEKFKILILSENWRVVKPEEGVFNIPPKIPDKNELLPQELEIENIDKISPEYTALYEKYTALKSDSVDLAQKLVDEKKKASNSIDSLVYRINTLNKDIKENYHALKIQVSNDILKSIDDYNEDFLNLYQKLTTQFIADAFLYSQNRDILSDNILKYDASRENIAKKQGTFINSADEYLAEAPFTIPKDLRKYYSFALDTIHKKLILPLNEDVFGQINAATSQRKSRLLAKRKAKQTIKKSKVELTNAKIKLELLTQALTADIKQYNKDEP